MIKRIIEKFFGWETILITSDMEEYARVRGKLIDSGIRSKTKISGNSFTDRKHSAIAFSSVNRSSYEIFVKKEDVYKANQVINQR